MPASSSPTTPALLGSVGWFVTGALWFAQAVVPWTAHGSLSHSSSLDAASLIRSGAVGPLAPSIAGWLLLTLPVVGLVLAASAFSHHRATRIYRYAAVVVALFITVALTHYLADFQITMFGPGALLAWLGCVASLVVLAVDLRSPS